MKTITMEPTIIPTTTWAEVGKILAVVLPIFFAVLHFINRFFQDKEKDRIALISDVAKKTAEATVKESMIQHISPLEEQIRDVSNEVKIGLREVHNRIDEVLKVNRS